MERDGEEITGISSYAAEEVDVQPSPGVRENRACYYKVTWLEREGMRKGTVEVRGCLGVGRERLKFEGVLG